MVNFRKRINYIFRIVFILYLFNHIPSAECKVLTKNSDSVYHKILFIGNSYTANNYLPNLVDSLARASNKQLFIDELLVLGAQLDEILARKDVKQKINQQKWDYIVLQSGSLNITYPYSHQIIVPSYGYHPLYPALEEIRDIAYQNCSHTKIVYFMPWGYKDGMTWVPGQTDTFADMQKRIYENSVKYADELGIMVAPIGWAWNTVINENPEIELFSPDLSHPSLRGSYLAACVIYTTLFYESVSGNLYLSEFTKNEATYFQKIASETVLNNLELWNITASHIKFRKSSTIPNFTLFQNYPNPFNLSTNIMFKISNENIVSLEVFNYLGQKIATLINRPLSAGEYLVKFNGKNLSSGTYYYKLKTGNQFFIKSMILIK